MQNYYNIGILKRTIAVLILLLFVLPSFSQTDTSHIIKIHFLYGSKPKKNYKGSEAKYFGGLHGGHVSIEVDSIDYGFVPNGRLHIFPHKRKRHSAFISSNTQGLPVYPDDYKVVIISIPVTQKQYIEIKKILSHYDKIAPYDYAFFGMRCAAATEDVLGQIGILKDKTKLKGVRTTFYPKKLRRRLIKLAEEKGWKLERTTGRKTRKWEKE